MATINTTVLGFPDKVPVNSTMHITVEVDNRENVAPITGGNCKPEDTQGELTDVSLEVNGPDGGVVANQTETVCALYGWNRPNSQVTFSLTPRQEGQFIANIVADTQRDRGSNNRNELGPFRFDVVPPGQAPEPPDAPDDSPDGSSGSGLLNTVIENPVGAGIVLVGGLAAVNSVTSSVTEIGQ